VPAGNGRPSGQWTSGDWPDESSSPDETSAETTAAPRTRGAQDVQIADSSDDWPQYLIPVGTAEAAESGNPPFNGVGPNAQHARAVAESDADFAAAGLVILARGKAVAVQIPGFATPRVYDFVALDPETGELVGFEVKTTKLDVIALNFSQVEKDIAVYELGGVYAPSLGGWLTSVAYDAACDGCENLNIRSRYLRFRLWLAHIPVYTRRYIGSMEQ
jgi:hypothetical protein